MTDDTDGFWKSHAYVRTRTQNTLIIHLYHLYICIFFNHRTSKMKKSKFLARY